MCAIKVMSINEIQQDNVLYGQVLALRYQLFFKEHNLPWEILNDEKEGNSTHITISHESDFIAYGRLSALGNGEFQISQMVVSPNRQSQGYGTKLLLKLIQVAKSEGAKTIVLNARTSAKSLYMKQGFYSEGLVYDSLSTGAPHIKMVHNTHT